MQFLQSQLRKLQRFWVILFHVITGVFYVRSMIKSMLYDNITILNCYLCPCNFFKDKTTSPLIEKETNKYLKCLICFYPWPIFVNKTDPPQCFTCRGRKIEVTEIPYKCCGFTCQFCKGFVPHPAILSFFQRLISPECISARIENSNACTATPTLPCTVHNLEYRFYQGEFKTTCSSCNLTSLIKDENQIREHINEIRICCSVSRTMYSAIEYNEHILIQCKECLFVEVVRLNKIHKEWLSSGNFGTPFCERKVFVLSDLSVGDHLIFIRALYEHHVIVISVDRVQGSFKQIGFTTPKIKGIMEEQYEMTGKILILEIIFKTNTESLVVVDYLPLDVFHVGQVLIRAFSKLDEEDYSVFSNNCEHLSSWCKYGRYECVQVKKAFDKYTKRTTELINTQVMPTILHTYQKIDNVVKEDPTLSHIQAQVISTSKSIKESINNSLKQMLKSNKVSHEENKNDTEKKN